MQRGLGRYWQSHSYRRSIDIEPTAAAAVAVCCGRDQRSSSSLAFIISVSAMWIVVETCICATANNFSSFRPSAVKSAIVSEWAGRLWCRSFRTVSSTRRVVQLARAGRVTVDELVIAGVGSYTTYTLPSFTAAMYAH